MARRAAPGVVSSRDRDAATEFFAQGLSWWIIDIKRFRSKKQFLGYAGRYARRPPIAQHRFREIDRQKIRFVTKDTRTKRMVETTYTPAEFLTTLADHIPDRYRHNIRYFGLLAPRVKGQTHDAVFALLGQERLGKPRPLRWAASMKKSFGVDPLLDREGQQMRWARRMPPAPASGQVPQGAGSVVRYPSVFTGLKLICCPRVRRAPCGRRSVRLQRFDPCPYQDLPSHCG